MRNGTRWWLAIALLAGVLVTATEAGSRLMRFADIHQDRIVFTYEGDLWIVPTSGGVARRLTRDAGSEVFARFSPDGKQLAFTASYDGGVDVYVMPAEGGEPRRLTWHPAADLVLGWTPDGKQVLFRSRREYPDRADEIYVVPVAGGQPVKLPVDRAGLTALSPDGKSIAFNRISREFRTWKRYQGGMAQDIWVGNLEKGDFRKLTDWPGTDSWPMWSGDAIYFVSDRDFDTLNLFRHDIQSGEVSRLTDYRDYDVKYPAIGPEKIVYQYAGGLHVLDLGTGKTSEVEVEIHSDRVPVRPAYVSPVADMGSFGISPKGDSLLLETRGEIVAIPVKKGEPVNLTAASGTREKNAAWSPDGKKVAFVSDRTGEEELYLVEAGGGEWKQLTTGGYAWRMQPVWSPDGKWLAFGDKYMRLNVVDATTGAITVADQGEYDDGWERWGIRDYAWSPDSRWIAYARQEANLNQSIFLYGLEDRKVHRVTDDMTQDWSPSFDPKGRYLYFLSERTFNPTMGFVDQNHIFLELARPYVLLLQKDRCSPFAPKNDEPEGKKGDEGKKGEKSDDKTVQIDFGDLDRRVVAARGVPAGNYFRLEATDQGFLYLKKDEPQFLKYQAVNDHTSDKVDLYHYNLAAGRPSLLMKGIQNYHQASGGPKLVYRSGSTYGVVPVGKPAKVGDGRIKLSDVKFKIVPAEEFLQIYNEAWRVQRDWFYDPGLHGVDWVAIGEKYRKMVPYCGNRADLNYLIGEMISELSCGHTYIYGGERRGPRVRPVPVGLLGAEFAADPGAGYHRISRIVPGLTWDEAQHSPLGEPGCPIRVGHYLLAIDGEPVTVGDNVYRHLENKVGQVVEIRYNDQPSENGARTYRVKPVGNEMAARYREWVDQNRRKVAEASGGQLGYVHIPNMGEAGCIEFARAWFAQYRKKGMVIDVRYNGGGFTGDMLIDRIERKLWSITQPREGKTIRNPERCFHGSLVVLLNEDTGSNGEYFSEAMKRKGLAHLIGMRTWGGAVGIEPHQKLVDGGTTTPPQFAPYGMDGKWMIEGVGVVPDQEVQNMPGDVVRGRDAQLEAGVTWLRDAIQKNPKPIPPTPAYPVKKKG